MRGCWIVGMYGILVGLRVGPGVGIVNVVGGGSGGSTDGVGTGGRATSCCVGGRRVRPDRRMCGVTAE